MYDNYLYKISKCLATKEALKFDFVSQMKVSFLSFFLSLTLLSRINLPVLRLPIANIRRKKRKKEKLHKMHFFYLYSLPFNSSVVLVLKKALLFFLFASMVLLKKIISILQHIFRYQTLVKVADQTNKFLSVLLQQV